jgi:hemerythrin-like metal-binding protein
MKAVEFIHWKQEYELGIDELDVQHKELMNQINDLISRSGENNAGAKKNFQKMIITVGERLEKHFQTEEKILSKTEYEKFEEHKNEHEKMTAKISKIRNEPKKHETDNKTKTDQFNFTVSLREWFLSHILLYDMEARDFFKAGF